ncbi:hypothetical protein CCR75_006996 [Bremia lactucae]|uniref:Uncharacterized protein n=1 Tax=Bremia lactucae TaxID=4779 RepID=A0A976IH32_BRELC|nr:hypothetical protein CCR75_006996 [Bremia lactucae]
MTFAVSTPSGMIFQNVDRLVSFSALTKVHGGEVLSLINYRNFTLGELDLNFSYSLNLGGDLMIPVMRQINAGILGLLCEQRLRDQLRSGQQLELSDFAEQWHLYRPNLFRPQAVESPKGGLPAVMERVATTFRQLLVRQQQTIVEELETLSQKTPVVIQEPEPVTTRDRPFSSSSVP